jgi:hypothetical protein
MSHEAMLVCLFLILFASHVGAVAFGMWYGINKSTEFYAKRLSDSFLEQVRKNIQDECKK